MKTAIKNMMHDFEEVCAWVPIDENATLTDPTVTDDQKTWIFLRAPWQPQQEYEHAILAPPGKPPRKFLDRYKSFLSKWFLKETLATQQ